MSDICKFTCRFGNNIFQLSAALKISNGDLLVNPGKNTGISGFTNLKLTNKNPTIKIGCYLDRKWLLPKDVMLPYIKKVSAPSYEWVLHIRGGDYTCVFKKLLRSREHILYQFKYFNINPNDLVIVTDDIKYTLRLLSDKYNILHSNSFIYDWWVLRNSRNIILSPGTFSYTAAYLGDHDKVVMPKLWPWDIISKTKDPTSVKCGKDLKFDTWVFELDYNYIKSSKSVYQLLTRTKYNYE